MVQAIDKPHEFRLEKRANANRNLFFSNKSVLIVPGFMGSQLRDM